MKPKSIPIRSKQILTTILFSSLLLGSATWWFSKSFAATGLLLAIHFLAQFALYRLRDREPPAPMVIWMTGLSGAGKTTLAQALVNQLKAKGHSVAWLDGDKTRSILPTTGFSKKERDSHILRTGLMAKTLEDHGITVVASFISPYQDTRAKVAAMCGRFVVVHIATPLGICQQRDPKGLYARALAGEIRHFTGIDDPYEPPINPDIRVDTSHATVHECVQHILVGLEAKRS